MMLKSLRKELLKVGIVVSLFEIVKDDRCSAEGGESGDVLDVAINELNVENQESMQNEGGENGQPLGTHLPFGFSSMDRFL
jgi:hypothetical protein